MNKYYDVIRRTLELAETGQQSLEHLPSQLEGGQYELAIGLFQDFVQAFMDMDQTVEMLKDELNVSDVNEHKDEVVQAIQQVVEFFKTQNYQEALVCISNNMLTAYKLWKQSLEQALQPYILT